MVRVLYYKSSGTAVKKGAVVQAREGSSLCDRVYVIMEVVQDRKHPRNVVVASIGEENNHPGFCVDMNELVDDFIWIVTTPEINEVKKAMVDAEDKAWKALAGYKFWMFGYHAGRWINYNTLLEKKLHNPFKSLVHMARTQIEEMEE